MSLVKILCDSVNLMNRLSTSGTLGSGTKAHLILGAGKGLEDKRKLSAALLSYPRLCYELAFLMGSTAHFNMALELEEEIGPVKKPGVHYLREDQGGLELDYTSFGGRGKTFDDFFEWKSWRHLTLRHSDWSEDSFTTYSSLKFGRRNLFANRRFTEGNEIGRTGFKVTSIISSSNSASYRFKYGVARI